MTKLWLIRQTRNNGYDTYDSAVVAKDTEVQARHVHPSGYLEYDTELNDWVDDGGRRVRSDTWVHPRDVIVEYLGETDREISGVIIASFNAG